MVWRKELMKCKAVLRLERVLEVEADGNINDSRITKTKNIVERKGQLS